MKFFTGIFFFSIFQGLLASVYYVSPDGNDLTRGTILDPWKTWAKAFKNRLPGDTVYFRGGVYYMTVLNGDGYTITVNGTPSDSVYFLNFPGEKPILDCSTVTSVHYDNNVAMTTHINYVKIRGLTIRNVWQIKPEKEVQVWTIEGGHSVIENCTVYNSHGRGFFPSGCNELYLINCDSYNHCDALTENLPGNDGYGFFVQDLSSTTNKVYLKGCRAWRCGDDGFTCYSKAIVVFENCWSFYNGAMQGEGHGFKLGWQEVETTTVRRIVRRCLATWNLGHGFTTNEQNGLTSYMQVYNNTSYHNLPQPYWGYNSSGFIIFNTAASNSQETGRDFKNNVSYEDAGGQLYLDDGALYTHANNSWDLMLDLDEGDFQNTDTTGLTAPRIGITGKLPDMQGFLEPSENSDLIDVGVDVDLPYSGSAPDIGFAEFKNNSETIIKTNSIVIRSDRDPVIDKPHGTLQLYVSVLPENTTDKTVYWSIEEGSEIAVIDPEGKVTALDNGTVVITAKASDGSGVTAIFNLVIENQNPVNAEEVNRMNTLSVFSDPDNKVIHVIANQDVVISVYTITGSLIDIFCSRDHESVLPYDTFVPGIYIVAVNEGKNSRSFILNIP